MNTTQVIILLMAFVAANVTWFSEKIFFVIPVPKSDKNLGWSLLEIVTLYFVVGGIFLLAENKVMGQISPQHWEFYATTACLFLVFSFPGFVYRYLWRRKI